MRIRSLIAGGVAVMGLFVTGAVAQHEDHQHGDQAPPAVTGADAVKPAGMMSQMPEMMAACKETTSLVDRLTKTFAAIEVEKDPAARTQKLAEHGALLKELRVKVEAHSAKMEHMMGDEHKK